jgi:hypothetical protein
MKNKDLKNKAAENDEVSGQDERAAKREQTFPGYPTYPASEDIMNQEDREDLDIEEVTGSKKINNELAREQGTDFIEDDELDVPGSELDDADELTGDEDEENNYYSLGGDRHEDLEETNEDDI